MEESRIELNFNGSCNYNENVPVSRWDRTSEGEIDALFETNGIVFENDLQRFSLIHASEPDLFVVVTSEIPIIDSEKKRKKSQRGHP